MDKPIIQNEEEFFSVVHGENDDYEIMQHDEEGGKHDVTNNYILVKYKDKYYEIVYGRSYNDGIQFYDMYFPLELEEVEVTEVKRYTWKVKR